ncbi:MAG TPA: GNAT family N-acetyltransferase [Chthoniobacterales bacterium]|nr:GNAT family N-acetyltransferase [Chthoniobacterales bacterium]
MNFTPVCATLGPEHALALAVLFNHLREADDAGFFHPHPLTDAEAAARANYSGRDFYCVMLQDNKAIGYGMLRGWDDGYDIPSLGIALDPSARGQGNSRILMKFLHDAAKERGAAKVRLKVDSKNRPAIELYRSLGYVFQSQQDQELIGFLDL